MDQYERQAFALYLRMIRAPPTTEWENLTANQRDGWIMDRNRLIAWAMAGLIPPRYRMRVRASDFEESEDDAPNTITREEPATQPR